MQQKAQNKFEHDLTLGEFAEQSLAALMAADLHTDSLKVEVKRDFLSSATGNIAYEYECNGAPSGIASTQADWWGTMLDGEAYQGKVVLLVEVNLLREVCRKAGKARVRQGGDGNRAKMVVFRTDEILNMLKE